MAYKKQHIDLRANSCTMKEESYSLADIDELMEYMWLKPDKMGLKAENISPGYGCITHFGVISVDTPVVDLASSDSDDLCQSPLAKSLGSGHYVWIGEQASLGGKTAYSMFVLNISVWAIAYYCHKFRLPAFIYGELRGGSVHSEYREKVDVSKLLCTKAERYRKREECEVKVAAADSKSQLVKGECFEYTVPLGLFPAISESILRNISTLDSSSRAGAVNIALYGTGENAWRYRGLAYRGVKPMELII